MIFTKHRRLEELKEIKESLRNVGQTKMVWTNGCFDVFHEGHKNYLNKSRNLGDYLVVGLNSDSSVRKLKGEGRPINNVGDRGKKLFDLVCIDFITVFDEASPINYLKELKPDFYVKGGDYTLDTINQDERRVVESYGGKIVIIPMVYNVSTTTLIDKVKGSN